MLQLQEIATLVSSACSRGSDLQVEDGVLCCVAAWMGGKVRRIRVRVDSNEEEMGTCQQWFIRHHMSTQMLEAKVDHILV